MEFRDLGPLAVEFDGAPVRLSGARMVTVLATLLVHAGDTVSEDRLIDAVWGEALPQRAGAAMDMLIWRLRQVLEPDRSRREGWRVLCTEGTGYRLVAREQDIDSRAFALETADARGALAAGRAEQALLLADRALGRWRGPAYDGVPDAPWLAPTRTRLDDVRIGAGELRVQALLDLGRPEQAVAAAQPLVEHHPFRERLWAQLALGLYRAGRQAAALDTFTRARTVLVEELGVSPGPELAALQRAMLDQAPDLLGPVAVPVVVSSLPAARGRLHGRTDDLSTIGTLLRPGTVTTVTGPVGVGKTTLALAAAHAAAPLCRDGAQFVDLTRASGGGEVAALVASTLEISSDIPDVPAAIVRHLRGRDLLLVLDNCEHVLDAVAGLVEAVLATETVTVLATSREPLDLDREHEHRVAPLAIGATADDPAVRVFLEALGRTDPSATDLDRIGDICAAVGGLPLGIELAARRARAYDLSEVVDSLRQDPGTLRPGPRDRRSGRSLHDEIDSSVGLCEAHDQVVHRRLSLLTSPFTVVAAQAVTGAPPVDPGRVMDSLALLARRSLLTTEPRRTGRATRFRQLVPVRHHAARAHATADDPAAEQLRTGWVGTLVAAIPQRGRPGQRAAYDRLEDDLATVSSTIDDLLAHGDGAATVRVVVALVGWAHDRNRLLVVRRWLSLAVARDDLDHLTRALAEAALGSVLELSRQLPQAHVLFDRSVPVLAASPEPESVGLLVDIATSAWVGDDWAYGTEIGQLARQRADTLGLPYEGLIAEAVLAASRLFSGPPPDALAVAEELLSRPDTAGNGRAMLLLCATAGVAALFSGQPDAGLRWTAESLRVAQDLGVRNMGETLEQRGNHLAAAERPLDALRCFGAAATQYESLGMNWPRHDGTATAVDRIRQLVPADDCDRAWASGARLITAGDGVLLADWI